MLTVNVNGAKASVTINNSILPAPVEAFLQYQAAIVHANTTEINEARILWRHQLDLRQEHIDESDGAISNDGLVNQAVFGGRMGGETLDGVFDGGYIGDLPQADGVHWHNPECFGTPTPVVYNPANILGCPDGNFARFEVSQPSNSSSTSAASIFGENFGWGLAADFYVTAKLGPSAESNNYVFIEQGDSLPVTDESKQEYFDGFIGYAQITSSVAEQYYIGHTLGEKHYICVAVAVPAYEEESEDILVDCVLSTPLITPPSLPFPPLLILGVTGEGGGTIDPSGGIRLDYYEYDNVNITAYPDPGYELWRWIINGDEENAIYATNGTLNWPAYPCTIEAQFRVAIRTLTVLGNDYGTTSIEPDIYEYPKGEVVPITALWDSGCVLDHWILDNLTFGDDETLYLPMDYNYTLQPVFREATAYYDLTLFCSDQNGTLDQSDGVYNLLEGTHFNVTATPVSGYWMYWRLDDQPYDYSYSTTVTIRANHTLQARFVSESLDEEFGNKDIFESQSNTVGTIRGETFSCPENWTALSITAAIRSACISNDLYVRYAIYRLDDWSLVAQTEVGVVESQGVYSEPLWQTLNFSNPKPVLQAGVDYVLVVWAINDPWGIYIAATSSENQNGVDLQYSYWCLDLQDFNYPSTLDSPNSNYDRYSIYCTLRPIAP